MDLHYDPKNVKLGKKEAVHDSRTLKLEKYLDLEALNKEPFQDWTGKVQNWGMMLNDKLGCCTIAAAGHMEMGWSSNVGKLFTPPDTAILQAYEDVGGYNPEDPNSDQGCVILDVLKYWRTTGIAGHKIGAFVSVDFKHVELVKAAIFLFGSIDIGLQLPISAQQQQVWEVTKGPDSEPGSWGGHSVPLLLDKRGQTGCVTWGGILNMTTGFLHKYCDEAYACLSPDWFNGTNQAPNGFDLDQLQADLQEITSH